MDPYEKAFKISLTLHATVALATLVAIFFGEVFRPRPTAIFTVMAPPAGLIAGGPLSSGRMAPSSDFPAPQGPKLPSPAPSAEEKPEPKSSPKAAAPKKEAAPDLAAAAPHDDFLAPPKSPKRTSENGTLKKTKPSPKAAKAEKLSYSDYMKKYGPKTDGKSKSKAKASAAPTSTASGKASQGPSFEENFASRLDRRLQEEGDATVGTGLGGAPGSGVAGDGIAGATLDPDALYTGTVYTYLNSVWEEPKEVGNTHLSARVEFNVDRSGNITAVHFTKRSGVDTFDKSIDRVFQKVKQVSAPPTNQDYLLSVTFETRDS